MAKITEFPKKVIHHNEPTLIQKSSYSSSLLGCFFRSKQGLLIFVNENLSKNAQKRVISIIKKKTTQCKVADLGVVKSGFKYQCGGMCCKYKGDSSAGYCGICEAFKRQSKTGID